MTGSAMAEALDQIGPTVPHVRLCRIGLKRPGLEIDQIPGGCCRSADVERKPKLIRLNLVVYRLQCAQIGPDRRYVFASNLGVGGIRHRWVEASPRPRDALMHRPP